MNKRCVRATAAALTALTTSLVADLAPWHPIPATDWNGLLDARVPALQSTAMAVVALPAKDAQPLTVVGRETYPPGLYEARLTVRPSHVNDAIAFHTRLQVLHDGRPVAEFGGHAFARTHQPEIRRVHFIHPRLSPVVLDLQAASDVDVAQAAWVAGALQRGGPTIGDAVADLSPAGPDTGLDLTLDVELTPETAVYFLIDAVDIRPLSRSGRVSGLEIDKIRYLPGETLKGQVTLEDVGGHGGQGHVVLSLEHHVGKRREMRRLPVVLTPETQTLTFDLLLPERELGYALVAEYVSQDGADRAETAVSFNLAANFQRVAIFGGGLATRDVVLDDATILAQLAKARANYFNAVEYFSWAEDDMVGMSPDDDFWSSGQTNYRMHKSTIQHQIRLAQAQGFAVATYGKFTMSGLPGWETAYDYPYDHRGQYNYPIGMWAGVNVRHLDRRRDRDFRIYSKSPRVHGNAFQTWWSDFMPIGPDPTPRMVRIAAEEVVRSIDLFGWDAIRWDGHPRGAGWAQVGRSGNYQAWAARRTQSLVRYFKDIVAETHPDFRHGYNYLLIERDKGYDWAVEDFELDELCREGGLIMNESIGNASAGWTFAQIARNLQVEGDLVRERGGFYLGISFADRNPPRDILIESALWAAAGCRPYNAAMSRDVRRYCTRFSHYTFDERLRRLATPEAILAPTAETTLWWQPFVYETPLEDGHRRLIVNLLNLPLAATRPPRDGTVTPAFDMPPGTDPVGFVLTLPPGIEATAVTLIDPQTLATTPLPLIEQRFEVPAVAVWQVAIVDLAVDPDAPSLAALHGPPQTLGVERPDPQDAQRWEKLVLAPETSLAEVENQFASLKPQWEIQQDQERAARAALTGDERVQALMERRQPAEKLLDEWWKGAALPGDLALRENPPVFGDMTPRRNGRLDIFHGRGAMDYRLRLPSVFASLDRFRVHDARLAGAVRQTPGLWLEGSLPPRRYAEFDVLLFTGVPHCAIGVEHSYAMVDYVKAGGAVVFTGGEYAFGKGGYLHTVLERELLPVLCAGMVDTVYANPPAAIEPGPDFAELGVELDFSAQPVYWVRNDAILKPNAKIFLASGEHPILVGWQLGAGRVVCLLVDHRGKSESGLTAFFDWPDWPRLLAGAIAWAAPGAGEISPPPSAGVDATLLHELENTLLDDVIGDLTTLDDLDGGFALPGTPAETRVELDETALAKRSERIERALANDTPELALAAARQLAAVANLSPHLRWRVADAAHRHRPPGLGDLGRQALATQSSALHGAAYLLLAAAGDDAFAELLANPPALRIETEAEAEARQRDLAMAVALYPKADLQAEGRRRIDAWNQREAETRADFARLCGPDTDMLETSPCLDADASLARLAWLAYLSRHQSELVAAQFLHEWLRGRLYQDYCHRTRAFLVDQQKLVGGRAAAVQASWCDLARRFGELQSLARTDVDALLAHSPATVGETWAKARFTAEAQTAINALGEQGRKANEPILPHLTQAGHPDLAAFARNRRPSPQPEKTP